MRLTYISILLIVITTLSSSAQSFSDADFKKFNDLVDTSPRISILESLNEIKSQDNMTSYDKARVEYLLIIYYITTNQTHKVIDNKNHQAIIDELKEHNIEEARKYMLNLSTCFIERGMFQKGLEILINCEKYIEKYGDNIDKAFIQQHYANLYYHQGDKKKALLSLEKAEKVYIKEGIKKNLSGVQNNMAVLYKQTKHYSKAIEYNKKSLAYSQELADTIGIANSYNNIGTCYSLMFEDDNRYEDIEQAIKYFELSSELKDLYPSINNKAKSNLAAIYNDFSKLELSEELYKSTISNAENNESWQYLIGIYKKREIAERERGNLEMAITFANKRADILEKMDEINRKNSIETIEVQREFFESKEKVAEQKNRLLIATTVILLLIIGSTFAIFRVRNSKLRADKKRIALENRVLIARMNPHFVFNALTAIQNSLLQNEPLQTAQYLSNFAKLTRLTFDMTQRELSLLKDEIHFINCYIDIQKIRFQDRFIFSIDIDSDIDINKYMIPAMLLQPLIENSIDHGFKNIEYQGELTVDIRKCNGGVKFMVKDNGIGFSPEIEVGAKINKDSEYKDLHALDILKQRLELMNCIGNSFKITKGSGGVGTVAKFTLRDA